MRNAQPSLPTSSQAQHVNGRFATDPLATKDREPERLWARARLAFPICAWARPIGSAVRAAQIRIICAFKHASPGVLRAPHNRQAASLPEAAATDHSL